MEKAGSLVATAQPVGQSATGRPSLLDTISFLNTLLGLEWQNRSTNAVEAVDAIELGRPSMDRYAQKLPTLLRYALIPPLARANHTASGQTA